MGCGFGRAEDGESRWLPAAGLPLGCATLCLRVAKPGRACQGGLFGWGGGAGARPKDQASYELFGDAQRTGARHGTGASVRIFLAIVDAP